MYSGVLGTELTAQIYMGVVYYQRLRHMVSDKFQVGARTRLLLEGEQQAREQLVVRRKHRAAIL